MLLLALLLSACGVKHEDNERLYDQYDLITTVYSDDSSATERHAFEIISDSSGLLLTSISANSNDAYKLRWYMDGTSDIIKYDTENMSIMNMDDEKRVVQDITGGGVILATDDYLFVFKLGNLPFRKTEGTPSRIYIYDLDANLINTVEIDSYQLFKLSGAVIYDSINQDLYLVLETYRDSNELKLIQNTLVKINVDGSIAELCELGTENRVFLEGYYQNGLVLSSFKIPNESEAGEKSVSFDLYDVDSETFFRAADHLVNGDSSFVVVNNAEVCYTDPMTNNLHVYSLLEQKEKTRLQLNPYANTSFIAYLSGDLFDEHILYSLENDSESHRMFLDLKDYSVGEIVVNDCGAPVYIFEETEKGFVLCTGYAYYKQSETINGVQYDYEEYTDIYKYISKKDFWAGSTNFVSYADMVYGY